MITPIAPTVVAPATREEQRHLATHREHTLSPSSADASVAARSEALATLRVSAIPFARVTIDDGPAAITPHTFELPAGTYRLRARFDLDGGPQEITRTVTLSAGETRTLGLTPDDR